MSTLVVIGYNEPYKAEEVRLTLGKLQRDYLIDLEDAVAAVKDGKGVMVDWRYADGKDYLPSDDRVKQLRAAP